MKMRQLLEELEKEGALSRVKNEVDTHLEAAQVISALEESPILFEKAKGSKFRVAAGLASSREVMAMGIGTTREKLLFKLVEALRHPKKPNVVKKAPCQENVIKDVDLGELPLLFHLDGDGGKYISAGVAIINDPQTGPNACYHRFMQLGKNRGTSRLIEGRQTRTTYDKTTGDLPIAFCIGNSTAVLLAASLSPPSGVNEMSIANAMDETPVVKCVTSDLLVPADSEIVLEGRITRQMDREGPFLDLTGTRDYERQQPVIVIDAITHRNDAIYQALLPGGIEHKLLMGMPKEPTIYDEVSKVCECKNALMTLGGGSWLHGIVQIKKRTDNDGKNAIAAAFKGHPSMKHVMIVDEDVDVYSERAIEWAIATRVQADKNAVVMSDQPGSSLDPSSKHEKGKKTLTAKMGIDATLPLNADKSLYKRVEYKKVDPEKYLNVD